MEKQKYNDLNIPFLFNLYNSYNNWISSGYKKQVQYSYILIGGSLYFLFQGSHSVIDWIINFRLFKKPYKRMKETFYVHSGYIKYWKSIEDEIYNIIEKIRPKQIISFGHSQGGAIALLFHEWIGFNLKIPHIGYAAGCPRVIGFFTNKNIIKRWENFTIIENGYDAVPHYPFSIFLYKKTNKPVHIGEVKKWYMFWKYFLLPKYHPFTKYIEQINKFSYR